MKKVNTPFIFDIETGGKSPFESSILSLSYFDPKQQAAFSEYAEPVTGSRLYDWPAENVWKPIQKEVAYKKRAFSTEQQIISGFINKLESLESGTEIAGWNIGYRAVPNTGNQTGFDLPFLATRARQYGLEERLQQAVGRHKVRDLGQEFAVNVANLAVKHSDLVDEDLLQSARGYLKYATNRGIDVSNTQEAAEFLGLSNRWMVGWKQEQAFSLLQRGQTYSAHISEEDVKALAQMYQTGSIDSEREFVAAWNKSTLANKAASIEKAASPITEGYKRYQKAIPISTTNKKAGSILSTIGVHLSENKRIYQKGALGLGTLGVLYALQPGSLFSGHKDEYNTIEGMREGGLAADMRHLLTDFGSPVDLAKAAMRAENLYKSHIIKALEFKGIGTSGIQWITDISEDVVEKGWSTSVIAKTEKGELLANVNRFFTNEGVDLTQIEVGKQLPAGVGKALYEGEAGIFKELGYQAGEKITSPVSSPITARWQMQMYKSSIDPQHQARLGDLKSIQNRILNKEITKEDFPGMTLTGRIQKRKVLDRVKDLFQKKERARNFQRKQQMSQLQTQAGKQASIYSAEGGKGHLKQAGREYKL